MSGERHEFENIGNLQWASMGLSYENARSDYRCKKCGKIFSHYYHQEPNIYKAMEKAGLKIDNCPEKKESDKR